MLPETAVAAEWRKVFTNTYVKLKLTLIAVDEAHCITVVSIMHVYLWLIFVCYVVYTCLGVRNSEKILSVLARFEH